jgi:hypothetical protein
MRVLQQFLYVAPGSLRKWRAMPIRRHAAKKSLDVEQASTCWHSHVGVATELTQCARNPVLILAYATLLWQNSVKADKLGAAAGCRRYSP